MINSKIFLITSSLRCLPGNAYKGRQPTGIGHPTVICEKFSCWKLINFGDVVFPNQIFPNDRNHENKTILPENCIAIEWKGNCINDGQSE